MRKTVGDVRGESLGEFWPLSVVGVWVDDDTVDAFGETTSKNLRWVVVNLTKDVKAQIEDPNVRKLHSCRVAHAYMKSIWEHQECYNYGEHAHHPWYGHLEAQR